MTVVIPAYNEEQGIAQIMQRVLEVQPALIAAQVERLELLVVDDGSRDSTCEQAQKVAAANPCVRVISHPVNRGYGAALKTGFSKAQGELVGFLDADGTYPPEYFPQLCQAALAGGDIVIGSRMLGAESKMPVTRRVGNLFFAGLLTLLGTQRVTDSASGMRVFKRDVLRRLFPLPDGLNLTPVMSTRAVHENLRLVEVPIPYQERVGRSKLSVVRDGRVFLESMLWTAMSYNPVQIFGMLGMGGVLLSALIGAALVINRLSGDVTIGPGWIAALALALVASVAGISLFTLGVTFNYLVSLFYERPIRQGLFGKPILQPPLETHFGWIGALLLLLGALAGVATLLLGLNGWDMNRLWMYLLGSAMMILIGLQLAINWIVVRMLGELNKRRQNPSDDQAFQEEAGYPND